MTRTTTSDALAKMLLSKKETEMAIYAFAGAPSKPAAKATNNVDATVSAMRLLSLADHEHLGDVVSARLLNSNSKHALECIKVILTNASVNLTVEDLKEITAIINVVKNEKLLPLSLKERRNSKKGNQGYANVERQIGNGCGTGGIAYVDYEDTYDDYDDFM
ncbi:hypothetical protein PsorP6_012860 [Peronosclerospora sorghi]|uniref:Uncharacterized protein n=1 Tax=Peronosclerospora sorghi TaxID=230839 RepID=A0ACC0WF39_9STRA|nr:hypothetical protein PsorP6_012860 [Peronosclerospora sorghi]